MEMSLIQPQGTHGSLEEQGGTRVRGAPQDCDKGFICPRIITMQLLRTSSFLRRGQRSPPSHTTLL